MRITSRWTSMSSPCSPAQAFPRLGAPIQALHGLALAGLCLTLTAGCRSTPEPAAETVEIELPETFSALTGEDVEIGAEPWWTTFGNESLDRAVDGVLGGNFELRQAWSRLRQSEASARAAGAPRIPSLDATGSARYQEIDQNGSGGFNIPIRTGETYSLGLSLGYEVDLFGRIDSTLKAARLEEAATAADVRATGLALSGRAVDAWLTIVERNALTDLVDEQVLAGEQLLELTEARFATSGTGSALDVLQQRRQLEGTRAELPLLAGEVERARYQLAVLTGEAPGQQAADAPRALPELPPLPILDVPSALLTRRPDVIAAGLRVESADANVAAAIAARYPRLDLSAAYNLDANELADIFDRTISSIAANVVGPIIDGGARRAEVDRQRATLEGAIDSFNQSILAALQEVEDALSLERRGLQRIAVLELQETLAAQELIQARLRYAGGVESYLEVLAAVQTEQALQRLLISERAGILRARAQLLRALGGSWTEELQDPMAAAAPPETPQAASTLGPR